MPSCFRGRVTFRWSCLLLATIVFACGCRNDNSTPPNAISNDGGARPVSPDEPLIGMVPVPESPEYIHGTTDSQLIVFLKMLIEDADVEMAFEFVHRRCLPDLEGEKQRAHCEQRLIESLRHSSDDIFIVSEYKRPQKLWDEKKYNSVVEPEMIVAVDPDWDKVEYPFQEGTTKWILAKSDGDWFIVMPALKEITPEDDTEKR